MPGAHADVPESTPEAWRERWADEAGRYRQAPLPETFLDPPNAGMPVDDTQTQAEAMSLEMATSSGGSSCPGSCAKPRARGWWDPLAGGERAGRRRGAARPARPPDGPVTVVADMDAAAWSGLSLGSLGSSPRSSRRRATRSWPPRLPRVPCRGGRRRARVVVGLAVTGPDDALLALGVAPGSPPCRPGYGAACESTARTRRADGRGTGSRGPVPHTVRAQVARRISRPPGSRSGGAGRHPKRGSARARPAGDAATAPGHEEAPDHPGRCAGAPLGAVRRPPCRALDGGARLVAVQWPGRHGVPRIGSSQRSTP